MGPDDLCHQETRQQGQGNWAVVCRGAWAWPAEPRRAGKVNQEHGPGAEGEGAPRGPRKGSLSSGKSASAPGFGEPPANPTGGRPGTAMRERGRVQELKGRGERRTKAGRAAPGGG